MYSPPQSVDHQIDIVMIFDECTPYPASEQQAADSMRLSLRWAERSKRAHGDSSAALFGIIQGGMYPHLRNESLAGLTDIGFDGYAIGGLSVGESKDDMDRIMLDLLPNMPAAKPRYLMGVGKPADLVGGVSRGIDMFDCVLPTRSGRTGQGFTRRGPVNLKNARHAEDPRPLDADCHCPACRNYSRAYLHHLFKAEEVLSLMLLSWHNIQYYQDLMAGMRAAITAGSFSAFEVDFHAAQARGDIEPIGKG